MDTQRPYSLSVLAPDPEDREDSLVQIQSRLRDFILDFRLDNAFVYRYAYDLRVYVLTPAIKFGKTC